MQPFLLNPKNEAVIAGREPYGNRERQLILPILLWVLTLVLAGFAIQTTNVTQALVNGKNVHGTIVNLRVKHDSESADHYVADYRFVIPIDGDVRGFTSSQKVREEAYPGLAVGQQVTVRYAENDPDNSSFAEYVSWSDVQALWLFTSFSVLASILTVFYHTIPSWRLITALRERGQMLPGHIVSAVFKDDGEGGRWLEIAYSFTSPGGVKLGNRQGCLRNDLKNSLPPPADTPVTVLHADDQHFTLL